MTIPHDLITELKDAGYPLKRNVFADKDILEPEYISPILEELIEACGSNNLQLTIGADGQCVAYNFLTATTGYGITPVEAFVRLWLAHDHRKV